MPSNQSAIFRHPHGPPSPRDASNSTTSPTDVYVFPSTVIYPGNGNVAQIQGSTLEIAIGADAFNSSNADGALVGTALYEDIPTCPNVGFDKFDYFKKQHLGVFPFEKTAELGQCKGGIYCVRVVSRPECQTW